MSSKRTPNYRTSNLNANVNCSKIEESVREQVLSVNVSLRAAAEPIVQLPAAIQELKAQGRDEDVPKLLQLGKSIARDFDTLTLERDEIDKEFKGFVDNRPTAKSELSRYAMNCTMTGLKYIGLNDRIASTLTKSAEDFQELLDGPKGTTVNA